MSIESNIWKLNADRFIASFWLFAPILVSYYEANGLNASEVYLIQAVFALALAFCEVPTGYFSDVVGRKAALIIGAILIPAGIATYALTSSFWGFVLAEILLAIGLSLRSGTDSALLYDSLLEMKRV
jgi:MFS family permease